jgi:hypothetical protein
VVDLPKLVATTGIRKYEEDRFPNLILRETADAYVYLNDPKEFGWATPVQTYLELSRLDKREKEIAEEVRKVILEPFR